MVGDGGWFPRGARASLHEFIIKNIVMSTAWSRLSSTVWSRRVASLSYYIFCRLIRIVTASREIESRCTHESFESAANF